MRPESLGRCVHKSQKEQGRGEKIAFENSAVNFEKGHAALTPARSQKKLHVRKRKRKMSDVFVSTFSDPPPPQLESIDSQSCH